MNYEHVSAADLIRELTGRTISPLPRLRAIARDPDILLEIQGVSKKVVHRIEAALELGRRYVAEPDIDPVLISSPEDIDRIYGPRLRDRDHEPLLSQHSSDAPPQYVK